MADITIETMNKQISLVAELRSQEAEASMKKKVITDQLEIEEGRMLDMLTESNLKNYRGPDGMAAISLRTSVRLPQTDEDKAKFYEHLKELGLYESMISVNSQKLNSFYKAQLEQALEEGRADFQVPGITEVTMTPILSFRK